VAYILKNPIYCGRARLLRYAVTWEKRPDEHGELWDQRRVTDRLRDPEAWESETLPLADGVVPQPYVVSIELWERVQQRIIELRANGGKINRYENPADATLLQGGFVRCQQCGAPMSRYWHKSQRGQRQPYYRCAVRSNLFNTCPSPIVPAAKLDKMVLGVVASVLADPKTLCDWADANESQMEQATREVALADATLEALRTQVSDLSEDATRYRRVLNALDAKKDAEEIALYNDKLQHALSACEQAKADLAATMPKTDHAHQREWLFRTLRRWSEQWPRMASDPAKVTATTGVPGAVELSHIGDAPLLTPAAAAIFSALDAMQYDLQRRLLHDLRVVVYVNRARTRAERALRGMTPLFERVTVRIGVLELRLGAAPQAASQHGP
jgi:hypothetical protein